MGMASTLMLGGLMVTAGFALVSQCISHVLVSTRLENLAQARSLAEAAGEQALAKVLGDPTFGTSGGGADTSRADRLSQFRRLGTRHL